MAITGQDVVTVQTSGGEILVRDTGGDGPPVLLVHSLLLDADLYSRLTPLLVAAGLRCLVPDLPLGAHTTAMPGADLTPGGLARLLVDVLDARGVGAAHVVGVDTGGALAQLLMASHRERVQSVVLTACDAYEAFPPRSFAWAARLLQLPGVLTVNAALMRSRRMRRLGNLRAFTHAGVSDDQLLKWFSPGRSRGIRHDLRAVLAGMHPRWTLEAARLNGDFPRPVTVAWGDDDRVFPRRLGERLAADIPGARLVTLPDCAAFAALDQPALLADIVAAQVTSADGGQVATGR